MEIEKDLREHSALDDKCESALSGTLSNYAETDTMYDGFCEEVAAWNKEFPAEPLIDAYYANAWAKHLENAGISSNMSGRLRVSAAMKKLEDFDASSENADEVVAALCSEIVLQAVEAGVITTIGAAVRGAKSSDTLPTQHETL